MDEVFLKSKIAAKKKKMQIVKLFSSYPRRESEGTEQMKICVRVCVCVSVHACVCVCASVSVCTHACAVGTNRQGAE